MTKLKNGVSQYYLFRCPPVAGAAASTSFANFITDISTRLYSIYAMFVNQNDAQEPKLDFLANGECCLIRGCEEIRY
jgi:hypothetical protein